MNLDEKQRNEKKERRGGEWSALKFASVLTVSQKENLSRFRSEKVLGIGFIV